MQRTRANEFFLQSWASVFFTITVRVSLNLSYFNKLFFGGMMANFDIHIFIIARENSCKIARAPYGVRLISYIAGRAPADVFIYRRRSAPVRYVTTQKKILKNRPVPGRLSNSPVMCKSLKSYDVSFICDRSIRNDKGALKSEQITVAGLNRRISFKCLNSISYSYRIATKAT